MDDICEWFDMYVDINENIVVFEFSDGTKKFAKRGAYMADIEDNLRKMLNFQIEQEINAKEN